jgi:hypothetical protein
MSFPRARTLRAPVRKGKRMHNRLTKKRGLTKALAALAIITIALTGFAASPASADHENGRATFFEHSNASGGWLDVDPGSGVADLRTKYVCWWWGCPNFNDQISSVRTEGSAALLFEHINFEGPVVCVKPHSMRNMPSNFNDRASSVLVLSGNYSWERQCPTTYGGRTVTILG